MSLLNTLMEICTTLSHKVAVLEQDKVAQALEIIKLKQRVKRLEKKRRSKHSGLKRLRKVGTSQRVESSTEIVVDAKLQGRTERKDDDNAAAKDVNAAKEVNAVEPIIFNDEEVTMTMAQTLIKMKAEKARLLDEQMAKRLHNEEVEQAAMQEKHHDNIKKYQSLKRRPIFVAQSRKNMIVYLKNMDGYKIAHFKDEEPTKKRVAEETLLQESFKKLRAQVEVSGSHFTQDTPTDDPKEMVEALQVKYLLFDWEIHSEGSRFYKKIIRILGKEKFSTSIPTEDKEKSLWVELKRLYEPNVVDVFWKLQRYMYDPLTWKLYTNCGVHQVSSTRRHDIFMFTEKDYPLTYAVLLLMLSTKLQVDEDCEVARDLVMKIFMEANKPKSKGSLDTSSK
nr:hypothetical protein [Tanacetum cinerariifolium]